MPAGVQTFDTFIGSEALPPPPTRHALLIFLIALAAILHLGTAGWSPIHNGAEGSYAGAARIMLEAHGEGAAEPAKPTLLHCLIAASYKLFGVSPAAARLPIAAAMIASVALTFLIGERLVGYWRGFVAGLIHLGFLGSFIWGRIVTPEPFFTLFLEGMIFCALCGYQRQRTRPLWFAGAALCIALACVSEGMIGLLYPCLIFLPLALLFREARLRFGQFLRWPNLLIFLGVIICWRLLGQSPGGAEGVSVARFVSLHAAWWFPALFLVLPGALPAWRKVFRPHEFAFEDALPLCWMAACFLPPLFFPQRQDYDSMPMWGALALWAACAWDRMPRWACLTGICLIGVVGAALPFASATGIAPMLLALAGVALLVAAGLAAYFVARERETLAIAIIMLAMVPVGLSAAEAMRRRDAQLSLERAAKYLAPRLGEKGEVLYEGSRFAGSSLSFYLEKPLFAISEETVLEKFSLPHPVYLIIGKGRVAHWQARLTERFHLYHQETTCGPHVVVSNQP